MYDNWGELEEAIKDCKKCKLCLERKNLVLGDGNKNADIMFIGDVPGVDEDIQGKTFVGKAGQIMNKAFEALEIERKDLYIANIVKCRLPQNRDPEQDEVKACMNYLRNQVLLVKPKIIVLLGSAAIKNILGDEYSIINARGKWIDKKGIWYISTFHPEVLLRDEFKKLDFWRDLKLVKEKLKELISE